MNRHIISDKTTILQALERLNDLSGSIMTLFVVDSDGVMTGTLTDGDVRRSLLAGASLDDSVATAMHRKFIALRGTPDVAVMRDAREFGVRLLPQLDDEGRVTRIYDLSATHTVLPISAILMAGGKGERLRPMTLSTPKPLLKIDGKPIIDYNVEALARAGIDDVTVTTRYLAEQIEEHFAAPVAGIMVKCIREEEPLGTIGAARLARRDNPDGVTLVMNSDLLSTISLEDMYLRHTAERADITVAAIPYVVSVPYAILQTDGPSINGIEEKPIYSYYANAGIYMISNRLLDAIPSGRYDATDLIDDAIASGKRVVYFPLNGTWIDIGTPTDFRQAEDLMRRHRDLTN